MVDPLHKKSWLLVIGLLFMVILSSSVIYAQAGDGTITVNACTDQNADGDCTDDFDSAAPPGVEACLDDDTNCQSIPATFTNLAAGSYTPFLRFPGASQGYYPTTAHTPVDLADGEALEVTLGAVYPVHPKGVAVHEQLNKVYVAFQGPTVISGTEKSSPYPFVAVIDGDTDEVLRTMPGGKDGLVDPSPNSGFVGIGREPWGVGVSGDGQYVYVGSFGDGLVSIIDPTTDMVMTDYSFGVDFMPTVPSVNPLTGNVHFPDYEQGHLLILGTDPANVQEAAPFIEIPPTAFSPFEVVTANALDGYNFVTLRDAILPGPYRIAALNSTDPFGTEFLPIQLPDGSSGPPFAIGLWQEEGMSEPRIFITHADDPRLNPPDVVNPNKLLVYSFPVEDPKNILLRNSGIQLGDFAEAGLVHDPVVNLMRGTFGGFAYTNDNGDVAACDNSARGGTYTVDFDGGISPGPEPSIVVGNPPLVDSGLQWKNPFEIAVNPNTGKVYVTDRCWNEFPEGDQPGGGAVLIFETSANGEATSTPTVTSTTTTTSTVTPTPTPGQITLVMNGPSSAALNETFSVDVVAQNVPDPGLYGAQFEINFDPALVSASNLQINPDLSLVIIQNVDNVTGKITLAAAREGNVTGLTGDVTVLTFEVTAGDTPSTANFIFDNVKIGDPQAQAFDVTSQNYSVLIGEAATSTPVPTDTPIPSTSTPTVTGTPPTATPVTTETPSTSTPTVTGTPPTATPVTTETPSTSTPTVTGTPPTATPVTTETPSTSTPTVTGTPPTATPVTTETPSTSTPTVTGTPPTATPTATGTPPTATPVTTETPSTSTPTVTGTPPTATPVTTGTPPTSTPTATGTPPTATPNVTVIVTSTGTPSTATPTVTGTPPTSTPTPTGTPPTATPTVTGTPPTNTPTPTPQVTVVVTVSGQVILPGRAGNDWSDTTVTIDDTAQSGTTDTEGNFSIADVTVGVHSSITARTTGFLSAACNSFTVTSSETALPAVSLLSGDVSDDDIVDITDATAIGISFGNTGSGLAADINRDDIVDILDIIMVGINFGTAGPQVWTCQ